MIKNHLKIAFRSLSKSKGYSLINVTGLAVGMACAVLIFLVVKHETSYDQSQSKGDRIYRVETENIKENHIYPGTYTGMANALRTDFPEAEIVAPFMQVGGNTFATSDKMFRESFVYAYHSAFQMLDYKWLSGNPEKALLQPNTIVLTRSYALKYFGTADVLGKTIRIDNKQDLAIAGVIEDYPATTSFPFNMLVSFSTLKSTSPDLDLNRWDGWNDNFQVFVLLKKEVRSGRLARRFTSIVAKYIGKEALSDKRFLLKPLSGLHFTGNLSGRSANVGMLKTLSFKAALLDPVKSLRNE